MKNSYLIKDDTLHNLHKILLGIIQDVDKLCRKHNITYYLNGGNALGAVRHNGFIPWDDDMDIMMHTDDYRKFLEVCRTDLDQNKWYVQEAWKDWPGCFSKLRLKGTHIEDIGEWNGIKKEDRGIYIDIFEIVNSPSHIIPKSFQYFCAKLLIAYSLSEKGYTAHSFIKRSMLFLSKLLSFKLLRDYIKSCVYRYSNKETLYVGNFLGMSRFRSAFYKKETFAHPIYHIFEDMELPLPAKCDEYLSKAFGNYMDLPPEDKRKPAHALNIDFGRFLDIE